MTEPVRTLASLYTLHLKELEDERVKYDVKKGPRTFHNLLHLIVYYREKRLLSEEEMKLAVYAGYVLAKADDFITLGCKRAELPIAALRIAGVSSTLPPPPSTLSYPPSQSLTNDFITRKRKEYEAALLASLGTPNPLTLNLAMLTFLFNSINRGFFDGILPLPKLVMSNKLQRLGAYYQKRPEGHKIAFSISYLRVPSQMESVKHSRLVCVV